MLLNRGWLTLKKNTVMNLLIKSFLFLTVICLMAFLFSQTTDLGSDLPDKFISKSEARNSDDKDIDDRTKVIIVDGFKAIQLDEKIIATSGLEFEAPKNMSFKPEFIAYADVVDIKPLVSLKTERQVMLAEQKILQNDLTNYNKILKRAEALHKVKSLSTRDLEKNRADRDLKAFRLSAMNTRLNSFEYKIKSFWGETLARFILGQDKEQVFDALASYKTSLILLSLPKNKTLEHLKQKVFVSNVNRRETARAVTYLDQAKYINNPLYGESYFYLLESKKLRAEMHLFAWIEEGEQSMEGVFVPESAVIWYANEPWIYLKHDEAIFVRKSLGDARKVNNGWLLKDDVLIDSDLIVTRGSQTLLSEEFKWAIPDEDDD
jgi:hypothetical protein